MIALISSVPFLVACGLGLPNTVAASIAIFTVILVTGALHEDGLGDVADGFGGGSTPEERLDIMKDSRLGTYGVIAVSASLILRISALAAVLNLHGAIAAIFALIAAASASRGAMVWLWSALPNAKNTGVSSSIGRPPESALSLSAVSALIFASIFGLLASGFVAASVAVGLGILALIGFQKLCQRMIGGQTGDTIGACQQLVEIAMLSGLAISMV
ncbi:MAG: adenosylcobinamide-GDP ribazoletransferase [Pseudomonadales bacterium]|nr:adenosylcobinamide-GDP ribazoletransferase [Pseudomonadales bacterium]